MENNNTYKKFDSGWLMVHDCLQIGEYNSTYRENNAIEEEEFQKVFISKEIDGSSWELNLEVSDDDDYITYESIDVRYCPYCSESLKEGKEEIPEDLKAIMGS